MVPTAGVEPKVALLYKKTGNLRACPLLLGHAKLESTVRYLGVEVDDALELSEASNYKRAMVWRGWDRTLRRFGWKYGVSFHSGHELLGDYVTNAIQMNWHKRLCGAL